MLTRVVHTFMLGEVNPLADWEPVFEGSEPSGDRSQYPQFNDVLRTRRETRASTRALVDSPTEQDLDKAGARVPKASKRV